MVLRLARSRDAGGVADLLWAHGQEPDELELARLVRFDPRRRLAIVATALLEGVETVVGIGAVDLEPDSSGPKTTYVLVDESRTDGLDQLLRSALSGRAHLLARRAVA